MDTKGLIEQILNAGSELAKQRPDYCSKTSWTSPQRNGTRGDALGMGKGAAIAGVMALLLGTKTGRGVTGAGLKPVRSARSAASSYKTYRERTSAEPADGQTIPQAGASIENLSGPQAEQRSLALLKAMIAAAKADGHIDARRKEPRLKA